MSPFCLSGCVWSFLKPLIIFPEPKVISDVGCQIPHTPPFFRLGHIAAVMIEVWQNMRVVQSKLIWVSSKVCPYKITLKKTNTGFTQQAFLCYNYSVFQKKIFAYTLRKRDWQHYTHCVIHTGKCRPHCIIKYNTRERKVTWGSLNFTDKRSSESHCFTVRDI